MHYEMANGEMFFDSDLHEKLNEIFFFRTADYIEDAINTMKNVDNKEVDLRDLVDKKVISKSDIFEYLANYVDQNDEKSDVIETLEEVMAELSKFKKYSKLVDKMARAYDIISDNMLY